MYKEKDLGSGEAEHNQFTHTSLACTTQGAREVYKNVKKKVVLELKTQHFISFADKPNVTSLGSRHP
jgi:hypothetical protein